MIDIKNLSPEDDEFLMDWCAKSRDEGWRAAKTILGLTDCTVRNDGPEFREFVIGRDEAYLELAPGEEASIRTMEECMLCQKMHKNGDCAFGATGG